MSNNYDLPPAHMIYRNWRGVVERRRIIPEKIWYGVAPPWHPEPGFLLKALCLDRKAYRVFDLSSCQFVRDPSQIMGAIDAPHVVIRVEP